MHFNTMPFTRKLSVILTVAGVILVIGHELELYLPDLELWIQTLGAFAPLGFILLFVVLTPVFVSVDTLCFAAGLLFSIGAANFISPLQRIWHRRLFFFWGDIYLRIGLSLLLPNISS